MLFVVWKGNEANDARTDNGAKDAYGEAVCSEKESVLCLVRDQGKT